jgi:hypothetical protein
MAGHDVGRTHSNIELTLSASNVSQLSRRYRAPASGIAPAPTTTRSAPAVANGSVYLAGDKANSR